MKNKIKSKRVKLFFSLIVMLFCMSGLALASNSYAQNTVFSINKLDRTVGEILDEIEAKSEFTFFLNNKEVDVDRVVSVESTNENIFAILDKVFAGTNVVYKVVDKHIVLSAKESATYGTQQVGTIKGNVKDALGEPVIGASVVVKGTTNGVVTDMDGNFELQNVSVGTEIEISYVGYQTQTVKATGNMNIVLKEDTKALEEVVVIGYGTAKKVNIGGAISTASSQVFDSRSVTDATTALQGEVPGLTIIRNGGNMDDGTTIRVRDISSINGGSPLVLIDGAVGDLSLINPADIANISVLKDGTAAIYGARAADGVILVTTKSAGKNQPVRVDFSANVALKTPALLKKTANLYQHAVMALEITDGTFSPEYSEDELPLILQGSDLVSRDYESFGRWGYQYPKFYKDQDWNDLVIGNGYQQNYNVNVSGGGNNFNYMVSLGYQREKGLVKYGEDLNNKYYVRAKAGINLLKNLKYDANLSYEAGDRDYSSALSEGQNIWELIYKTRTWTPLRNPSGHFYVFEGFDNPAQVLEEGGMANKTTGNFTFNNQLTWTPVAGLNIIGQAVIRKYDFDTTVENKAIQEYNWEDDDDYRTARTPNNSRRSYDKSLYRNFTLYAEYKHVFAEKHALNVMLGAAHESENYDSFYAQRINYDQQNNMSLQLGSSADQTAWSSGYAWTINSYFGRLNYTYNDKYIIEGVLRTDGSSRFASDNRWGWFPGVNLAWRVGEESFMKDLNIFDDLKIRASYGEMGNQSGIGYYDYIPLITFSSDYYPFGNGNKGVMASASTLTSEDRTWETIKTTNVGIDFAVLNNRLFGSFDYFWKKNDNMLVPITYPSMLGTTAPSTNSGKLKVNGWELNLGWRDKIGDFAYEVSFNLADSKNKVVSRIGSNLISLGLNSSPEGYPINSFFGYEFDGIIQNEEQLQAYKERYKNGGLPDQISVGDAMYKDLDNDGVAYEDGDIKYLGDMNPRFNFGFNLKAAYKGFDFSAFIQGTGRRTMFLQGEASLPMSQPWFQSAEYWYGKTWTETRTDAQYPALTLNWKRWYNYAYSTNTKFNVAYARLKNLQIGYTFPQAWVGKYGFQKLRVYFSGENLCEIHNTPGGWDPEENGLITSYPFTRTYSLGLNVVF